MSDEAWNKVKKLFGGDVRTDVRSPTEYRVTARGWHVHNGATTGAPLGDGRSLEKGHSFGTWTSRLLGWPRAQPVDGSVTPST